MSASKGKQIKIVLEPEGGQIYVNFLMGERMQSNLRLFPQQNFRSLSHLLKISLRLSKTYHKLSLTNYHCYVISIIIVVISSVATSMKKSSIERAQACSKMKIRARACSSIRKIYLIELLPGYLTENALFLPKFAYFQRLVCIEH